MNVVLIPCFNRPEFLSHCLENIQKADGADELYYIFRLDHGFDRANIDVIKSFALQHQVTYTPRTGYTAGKQSYSLLTGLIQAAQQSDGLVYLIEDDVIVGRDFFRWHQQVHADNPNLFSSHANLNINRTVTQQGQWDQYYLSHLDYGSIGTCFRKEVILEHIAPRATHAYFKSPVSYVSRNFQGSSLQRSMAEQDGLIRRIQERLKHMPTAHPHTMELDGLLYGPRCYHAGFYGKNRPRRPKQKSEHLSAIIYSDQAMRIFAGRPEFFADSRPCALELPAWEHLTNVPLQP